MSGRSETSAWLGLGGNIGDPAHTIADALRRLDSAGQLDVVAVSPLYRTPPWGLAEQPDFLNAVAEVTTSLEPRPLLDLCLSVEADLKRVRRERWGPRLIDVDILIYGDRRISEPGLEVPHPRMLERPFVVIPMAEIAPDMRIGGKSMREHARMSDHSGIERMTGDGNWWAL